MKIEQKHTKHTTFITLVTVGDEDGKEEFSLQTLPNGKTRLHFGSFLKGKRGGGQFVGTKYQDFFSREAALTFTE